jgi:hypothetical protein
MPKSQPLDNVSITGLVALTQTALGFGIGLLLACKLARSARRATAISVISLGAVSALPLIYDLFAKRLNRPESERRMRKRLESIREDSGFSEDAEVF